MNSSSKIILAASICILSALTLQIIGCGQSVSETDLSLATTTSTGTVKKKNCTSLSPSELERLQQLQDIIPYDVLVPDCLPDGFNLDENSVKQSGPMASGDQAKTRAEYETKPTYSYTISNGTETIRLGGNVVGDPGMMILATKQIRGRQGLVYYQGEADESGRGVGVPFETSSYYTVLWSEEKDLSGGRDRYGNYMADARKISWQVLSSMIDGMVSVEEALEASRSDAGNGANTKTNEGDTGAQVSDSCASPSTIGGKLQLTDNEATDNRPAWSPDGCQIVFESNRDGNIEIYSMNADGSAQTRITNNAADDRDPAWSPDGTKIVFASNRDWDPQGKLYDIYSVNADGSGLERLSSLPARNRTPSWSPDGSRIMFTSDMDMPGGVGTEIYVVSLDGSQPMKRLTVNRQIDTDPAWSPDGTMIAFYHMAGAGDSGIFVMNADGTGLRQLDEGNAHEGHPSWSPDGSRIVFHAGGAGANIICEINVDGTGFAKLPVVSEFNRDPSWSPDGSKIVFSADGNSVKSEIYVIDANAS